MRTIDDIRKSTAEARVRASKVLTADQVDFAAALAEEAEAKAALAAEETKARGLIMAERVGAAEAKAGGAYLVEGVDLVGLFLPGKAPPAGQLPGGGVIVVRNPTPDVAEYVNREVEHKKLGFNAIMAEVLCKSTVDPAPDDAGGTVLSFFCQTYPDAAMQAAGVARRLGGAKAAEDKRGRG